MSHLILLVALVAGTEPQTKPATPKENVSEVELSRLVEQLGSESYQEREAATRDLAALGERALPALKKAAASKDPEVRWRASKVAKPVEEEVRRRQIEAIKTSRLSPHDKGRKLMPFISKGDDRS